MIESGIVMSTMSSSAREILLGIIEGLPESSFESYRSLFVSEKERRRITSPGSLFDYLEGVGRLEEFALKVIEDTKLKAVSKEMRDQLENLRQAMTQTRAHAIPIGMDNGRFLDRKDEIEIVMAQEPIDISLLVQGPTTFGKSALAKEILGRKKQHSGEKCRTAFVVAKRQHTAAQVLIEIVNGINDRNLYDQVKNGPEEFITNRVGGWMVDRVSKGDTIVIVIDDLDQLEPRNLEALLDQLLELRETCHVAWKNLRICLFGVTIRPSIEKSKWKQLPRYARQSALRVRSLGPIEYRDVCEVFLQGTEQPVSVDDSLKQLAARIIYLSGGNPQLVSLLIEMPPTELNNAVDGSMDFSRRASRTLNMLWGSIESEEYRNILHALCLCPRYARNIAARLLSEDPEKPPQPYSTPETAFCDLGYIDPMPGRGAMRKFHVAGSLLVKRRLERRIKKDDLSKLTKAYLAELRDPTVNREYAAELLLDGLLANLWLSYSICECDQNDEPGLEQRRSMSKEFFDTTLAEFLRAFHKDGLDFGTEPQKATDELLIKLFEEHLSDDISGIRGMINYFLRDSTSEEPFVELWEKVVSWIQHERTETQ